MLRGDTIVDVIVVQRIQVKPFTGGSGMKNVIASMAKQSSRQQGGVLRSSENKAISQSKAIQHYYREIGIAAVAAAVRYQGDFKNAAYAPVAIEWYDRHGSAV
jgi:uncharacterized protein (DUF4213/DUF364 family)